MKRSGYSSHARTTTILGGIFRGIRETGRTVHRTDFDGHSDGAGESTAVAPALGEFGDRACLPYLQSLLEQNDPDLRRAAHMAISRLRDI